MRNLKHKNIFSVIMKLSFALVLCMFQAFGQVEVTDYGDVPTGNLAASRWENFKWEDPGNWTVIDVTQEGIVPNSSADIAPKINNLINNGNGNRIFKFPAGTFYIRSDIRITENNIQIVGSGNATRFLSPGGVNSPSITIRGSRSNSNYDMADNASRGDTQIRLTGSSGISVGTYIILTQTENGPRPSDPETQIVQVIGKSGNILTIDTKLGLPFFKSRTKIQRFGAPKNVRLSNFYFERTSKPIVSDSDKRSDNIELINARNVEISNIESNKAFSTHISMSRCTKVIVRDSYVHGNYGGGGGTQGGITMHFSSKIYVINNRTANMRHHIMTQFGTDHSVIAYNRAEAPYNSYQDIGQHNSKGCHNNLFEGNYGRQIFDDNNINKGWGTRYTTWYRNHATDIIGADHGDSNNNNIIGNEFKKSSETAAIAKGSGNVVGANIFGIDREGGNGNLRWKDLNTGAELPSSMFLRDKPDYVNRWPLYGPDATSSPNIIGPDGYTYAVDESGLLTISNGPLDIAYGQNGSYVFLDNQTEDIPCTNTAFGSDPLPGVRKYCFVRPSSITSISFVSPIEDQFVGEANLGVVISVENTGSNIANVRLYINDDFIRQENAAPYEWGTANVNREDPKLLNLTVGTYVLRAEVTDNGGVSTSISKTIEVVEDNTGSNPVVHLRKRNASGYALDGGVGGARNQNVKLWQANPGNVNQQWIEIDRGNGYYSYQKMNTSFCMDGGDGGANGQNLRLWDCDANNQNQQWRKVKVTDNIYRLEKRNANMYSIDGNNGGENNQLAYLWRSRSTNQNQHWIFEIIASERTTGVEEEKAMVLYPNPIHETLFINGKTSTKVVKIYDLLGAEKISVSLDETQNEIDVSQLSKGMYMVRIKDLKNSKVDPTIYKIIKAN
ncbi:T9SS type A sorting domain-containing protein [Aquimarina sp. SS2-1]|uniref:T9SS type A sorting domain-containing protein n=1 Tax=Aquimarina besae TaxID=3342247 RepID=UPI00366B8A64